MSGLDDHRTPAPVAALAEDPVAAQTQGLTSSSLRHHQESDGGGSGGGGSGGSVSRRGNSGHAEPRHRSEAATASVPDPKRTVPPGKKRPSPDEGAGGADEDNPDDRPTHNTPPSKQRRTAVVDVGGIGGVAVRSKTVVNWGEARTKGQWATDEDNHLTALVKKHGAEKWPSLARQLGTGRTAKQCRNRWNLEIDPSINKGPWTKEEDDAIMEAYEKIGSKWAQIAEVVRTTSSRRTDNAIKNRWNSVLKRRKAEELETEKERINAMALEERKACLVKKEAEKEAKEKREAEKKNEAKKKNEDEEQWKADRAKWLKRVPQLVRKSKEPNLTNAERMGYSTIPDELVFLSKELNKMMREQLLARRNEVLPNFTQDLVVDNPANVEALETKPGLEKTLIAHYGGYPVKNLILASTFNGSDVKISDALLILGGSFGSVGEFDTAVDCGGNSIDSIHFARNVFKMVEAVAKAKGGCTKTIRQRFITKAVMVDALPTPMPAKTGTAFKPEYKLLLNANQRSSIDLNSSYMTSSNAHYWAIGDVGIAVAQMAIHELDADKKLEFDFNSATSRISASMHPMGIGLRGGEGYILSPIDLYCIAQSSMNAHNALLGIPKEEVDGKLVLDIIKNVDWINSQNFSRYSSTEIDDVLAEMARLGESHGIPKSFVYPYSTPKHYACFSKSGVKRIGSLEMLAKGETIEKLSTCIK